MALPRILVRGPLHAGPLALPPEPARRLSAVLRLRAGAEFLLFAGDGAEWRASVTATTPHGLAVAVHEVTRQAPLDQLQVDVWCGLVRPARFEWAIEKCVEAGADLIRPLVSEHSARGEAPSPARVERWQRIAVEAAEQSGRLYVPVVEGPASIDALFGGRHSGTTVLCLPGAPPLAAVQPRLPAAGRIVAVVGPEGGLADEEVRRALSAGAIAASLGPNILRTETAAVAVTVLLRALSAAAAPRP